MLRFPHTAVVLILGLLLVSGCKKKQKAPKVAAQPPAITAPVTQEPAPEKVTPAVEVPLPEKQPADSRPVAVKPRPKPAARKPAPRPAEPKPVENPTVAKATPPRIVVQPGNNPPEATPATVVPEFSHTEETHRRLTTEQLMHSTEANLKSLRRVLNEQERAMLQQIQLFMTQSREASQAQDLVRAHNLALKAHLLSDELVR